ncbi:hypothetical protein AMS68_003176 [Peltaster fructicola]|uniref:Uncharacterized protein n=1 Tax=Peltaster fructicola TaxID=286661 RepID=A0A6H0XSR2_9PEZI|nr:hypothetical protein AMS68_003176 [Peltaster fructicola]
MPRRPRSRATSIASSQRSNDDYQHNPAPVAPAVISRLTSHNEELSAENEDLRQELERQKTKRWTLRDKRLAEQLKEYHAQHPGEPEQESQRAPQFQPDTTSAENTAQVTPTKQATSPPSQTSALVKQPAQTDTPQAPATVPRWRQLLTSLGGFSPFPARKPNTQRVNSTAKTPEPATQPASEHLETIAEQAELPPKEFASQTPTRPSRSMPPPQSEQISRGASTTPRRRTIRDVRAAQVSRTPLPSSGLRRWETPSKPREPNADKRLARMRELEKLREQKKQMESQIAKLAAEQEADGIDTRKRKRVKVDELAYIPHNNPGDAHGTFRVPDWDSDEEMEVDDEVPVRENLFSVNRTTMAPSFFKPAPAVQPAPTTALPPKSVFAPAAVVQQVPASSVSTPAADKLDFTKSAPKQDLFKPGAQAPPPNQPELPSESITPKPIAAPVKSTLSKPSIAKLPAPQASIFAPEPSAPRTAKAFNFPVVGPKQADEWQELQKLAAGEKFVRGFNSWLAVGLTA